jgi:hypothetical protein
MKKAYVYGMAGLVTAAVGVTAASGLWDGAESDAGEQHVPTALASTTTTPKAAPAPAATPVPAPVQVAVPAPAVKVAKPEARAVTHRTPKKPVKRADRPRPSVVRAAVVKQHVTPPVQPIVKPVAVAKPIAVALPVADPVTSARQALDNASRAVKDARRLLDTASADVKHAKSELRKVKHCNHKQPPQVKKTKQSKTTGSRTVSVSLDSSQVQPGQTKTITKSTADGSAWSSVTVTRK